ncbi:hypothetical protein [Streptosporangium roseum]|uniref:hypothetical protein n=1 Tax=Streptosporangium roseum TaxID=2001 RepID=UPI00331E4527
MRLPPALAAALDLVPIPHPFDLGVYLQRVEQARGRRLHIHELPAAATGAICGLWVATENADHIFIASGAVGLLYTNIVLHEISHMLLDHGKVGGDAAAALARLLRGGEEVQRAAARSRYDTTEEREAERLATLILMRSGEPDEPDDRDGLFMLGRIMGYHRR